MLLCCTDCAYELLHASDPSAHGVSIQHHSGDQANDRNHAPSPVPEGEPRFHQKSHRHDGERKTD